MYSQRRRRYFLAQHTSAVGVQVSPRDGAVEPRCRAVPVSFSKCNLSVPPIGGSSRLPFSDHDHRD